MPITKATFLALPLGRRIRLDRRGPAMRICCYTSTALPTLGGQELVVDALARQFSRLGHEVVVLAPQSRRGNPYARQELPYAVVRHPRFHSTRWFVAWYGRWLARLHRQHCFDVLHCHDVYPTAYIAARCTAVSSLPLIVTSHGGDLDGVSLLIRKPQLRKRYLLAMDRAAAAISVSDFTEQRLREVCPSVRRIAQIPNGVHAAQFGGAVARPAYVPPSVRSGEYLLFLGRLAHRKGVDLLLDAFRSAAPGNDATLVIAGDGPDRESLEAQAAAAGLIARCWFAGTVGGDVKTWLLQHARCLVVPSRISEAFGLVVLESYAAGRPVIATHIPGLMSIVDPERTGMLVPPDAAQPLAQALTVALRDRDTMDRLGRQAQLVAQSYDWNDIAARHLALFEELLPGTGCRRAA
jgi:glycosyltransferase involved in cell wall biosynthesis